MSILEDALNTIIYQKNWKIFNNKKMKEKISKMEKDHQIIISKYKNEVEISKEKIQS